MKKKQIVIGCIGIFLLVLVGFGAFFLGKSKGEKAKEGYDVVFASRQNRKDTTIKKTGSVLFNRLLGFLTDTEQDETIANYVLYKKEVVKAMESMGDYRRYYPLINHWVGFNSTK